MTGFLRKRSIQGQSFKRIGASHFNAHESKKGQKPQTDVAAH